MKIYCLSGLGVDRRAFKNFKPAEVELIHVDWIEPIKNESLSEYAKRLFLFVNLPVNYNLLGVSFGGMVAIEFAKIKQPEKLFLVSSASNKFEFPLSLRVATSLKLHKLTPSFLFRSANFITYNLFGVKEKEHKKLLAQILKDTDPTFLKWAVDAMLKWDNKKKIKAIKIHGTNDKMLPLAGKTDYTIQGGGHFMIVTHGAKIAKIIEKELALDN